jgi:hypothetical protein
LKRSNGLSVSALRVGALLGLPTELKISKPTLINWSRKFQFDIQNQRAINIEALQDKWLTNREAHSCKNKQGSLNSIFSTSKSRPPLGASTSPRPSALRNGKEKVKKR